MLDPGFAAESLIQQRPRVLRRGRYRAIHDGGGGFEFGRSGQWHGDGIPEADGKHMLIDKTSTVPVQFKNNFDRCTGNMANTANTSPGIAAAVAPRATPLLSRDSGRIAGPTRSCARWQCASTTSCCAAARACRRSAASPQAHGVSPLHRGGQLRPAGGARLPGIAPRRRLFRARTGAAEQLAASRPDARTAGALAGRRPLDVVWLIRNMFRQLPAASKCRAPACCRPDWLDGAADRQRAARRQPPERPPCC